MEIIQLHYFKSVAQHENFTKAAATLHMTQSALSKSIAQLERELGFPLFDRIGSKIRLNQNGIFYLKRAIQILNLLTNTENEVREMVGITRGVVNIAVSEAVFIKNIVRDYLLSHPDVRLSCRLQSEEQMRTSLEEGLIDFAVTKSPILSADLFWQPIFEDYMTVLLPDGHPLADRNKIHLEELSQEHFIISNMGYGMESHVTKLCATAGFTPYITYDGTGEDLAGMLVHDGLGIMITPYSITQGVNALHFNVDMPKGGVLLADEYSRQNIGIVAKKGHFQSAAALELYDMIIDYFAHLPKL